MPPRKNLAAKGPYSFANPVKNGTLFTDKLKKNWVVGSGVGKGGFGCLYMGLSIFHNIFSQA